MKKEGQNLGLQASWATSTVKKVFLLKSIKRTVAAYWLTRWLLWETLA